MKHYYSEYREHFAHLLEHLEEKVSLECESRCPIRFVHGGISVLPITSWDNYNGPNLEILLRAMTQIGLTAEVRDPGVYFPSPQGIDYLEQYRHPTKYWLHKNWFAVLVAALTMAVPIVLKAMEILFSPSSP